MRLKNVPEHHFERKIQFLGVGCAVPPPYTPIVSIPTCLYPALDLATPQHCRFTRSIQSSDIVDKCLLNSVVCSHDICRTAPFETQYAVGEAGWIVSRFTEGAVPKSVHSAPLALVGDYRNPIRRALAPHNEICTSVCCTSAR